MSARLTLGHDIERLGGQVREALARLGVKPGDAFVVSAIDVDAPRAGGARRGDPGTSKQAASNATPRTGSQRAKAMAAIIARGPRGATAHDVFDDTGIDGIWKRVSDLKHGGWLNVIGTRIPDGKSDAVEVYVPSAKARAAFDVPTEGVLF